MSEKTKLNKGKSVEDIICESRVYECECGFVGAENSALEHQGECDLPMELLK